MNNPDYLLCIQEAYQHNYILKTGQVKFPSLRSRHYPLLSFHFIKFLGNHVRSKEVFDLRNTDLTGSTVYNKLLTMHVLFE